VDVFAGEFADLCGKKIPLEVSTVFRMRIRTQTDPGLHHLTPRKFNPYMINKSKVQLKHCEVC
jgi:hypothetical protein